MGQSLTFCTETNVDKAAESWGSTAELSEPPKAFSRLLEMVTIMLQLKLSETWDRGAGAMGHRVQRNVQCRVQRR